MNHVLSHRPVANLSYITECQAKAKVADGTSSKMSNQGYMRKHFALLPLFVIYIFLHPSKCTDSCIPRCICETTGQGEIIADCRAAHFTEIPKPAKNSEVNILYLQFNRISHIRDGDFVRFNNLSEVSLEGNRISAIEEGGFKGLLGLRKLDISKNMIRVLPRTEIDRLTHNLEWLSVAMNSLSRIPAVLDHQKLRHFNASNNRFITEIPTGYLPRSLTELDLHFTGIKCFKGSSFRNLHNLRTLRLNDNMASASVTFESGVFDDLTNLEFLDLSRCYCKNLPKDSFASLRNLETLLMNKCWLSVPPFLSSSFDSDQNFKSGSRTTFLRPSRKNDSEVSSGNTSGRISYSPQLSVLDLSNNRRMKIKPGRIYLPPSLSQLHLGNTHINEVDIDMFGNLRKLEILDLCRSKIKVIESDSFIHLRNVSEICLSGNPLEIAPSFPPCLVSLNLTDTKVINLTRTALRGLKHVAEANLKRNRIEFIQDYALQDMVSLQALDLSQNKLCVLSRDSLSIMQRGLSSYIESVLYEEVKSSLLTLNLSFNHLREIAEGAFASHTQLLTLDLRGNLLQRIEDKMLNGLYNLTSLKLSKNMLNHIDPGSFRYLTKLEVLRLEENELEIIEHGTFDGLDDLTSLHLENNNLISIEQLTLPSIRILDISSNNLKTLPRIRGTKLTEMRASYNLLDNFSSRSLKHVANLEILDLSHCEIESIDYNTFQDTPGLKELYLNGNHITKFVDKKMTHLEILWIAENQIHSINNYINAFLPGIQFIDLAYNNISSLHPSIFYGESSLVELDLSGNNFKCDCNLLPLVKWIENNIDIVFDSEFYLCDEPSDAYAAPVIDFLHELDCEDYDAAFQNKEVILTGVSILVALISLLLLVLLILMLHRKSKSRRRQNAPASVEEGDLGIISEHHYCNPLKRCWFGINDYQQGHKESESISSWEGKALTTSSPATSTVDSDTQG